MTTVSPLGHEALLTLARKLDGAASDGDRDRVEFTVRRLLDALIDHIRAEQARMEGLAPEKCCELKRRQQQLVDDLLQIAREVMNQDPGRSDRLAGKVLAELTAQAEDERSSGLTPAMR